MSIQRRIQKPGVYQTSLQRCTCPDFVFRGGSHSSEGQRCCKHIRRLEQELSYFHTGWNRFAQTWICLCQDFEYDGACHHIQALLEAQPQVLGL